MVLANFQLVDISDKSRHTTLFSDLSETEILNVNYSFNPYV